jgi:hypothetical protein
MKPMDTVASTHRENCLIKALEEELQTNLNIHPPLEGCAILHSQVPPRQT